MNKVLIQYEIIPVKKDGSNINDPIKYSSIQKNMSYAYKMYIQNFQPNKYSGILSDLEFEKLNYLLNKYIECINNAIYQGFPF
jgi:hypothetical protein